MPPAPLYLALAGLDKEGSFIKCAVTYNVIFRIIYSLKQFYTSQLRGRNPSAGY
jgi:hypothetical protein